MSNKHTAAVMMSETRICPSCGAHAMEFHTVMARPSHAIAEHVVTSGERADSVFYVAGGCEACGACYEVANADHELQAQACPGCGSLPGDEPTEGCEDLEGCGFFSADDTLRQLACCRAQAESRNGYVQHVNRTAGGYTVSDWYDADATVASFENGRAL